MLIVVFVPLTVAAMVATVAYRATAAVVVPFVALPAMLGVAGLRMRRALRRARRLQIARPIVDKQRVAVPGAPLPRPLVVTEYAVDDGAAPLPRPGGPAIAMLFLWVFDDAATMSVVDRARRVGPVHMLRGGGMLVLDLADLPRMVFGRIDRFVEETDAEVVARIAGFRERTVLGYHPIHSMVCSDNVWKFALDRLLERTSVVVVDLSDFTAGRAGIAYEIGLLLDRVPLSRIVFVAGPETDRAALEATFGVAWAGLAADSPNRDAATGGVRLAVTAELDELSDKRADAARRPRREAELDLIHRLLIEAFRTWDGAAG